jgi:hypothetical protein
MAIDSDGMGIVLHIMADNTFLVALSRGRRRRRGWLWCWGRRWLARALVITVGQVRL